MSLADEISDHLNDVEGCISLVPTVKTVDLGGISLSQFTVMCTRLRSQTMAGPTLWGLSLAAQMLKILVPVAVLCEYIIFKKFFEVFYTHMRTFLATN